MVTILRGELAAETARALVAPPDTIVIRCADSCAPTPWGALRSLIAQSRAALGAACVERAVLPRRVMLSLALRGLVPSLEQADQHARATRGGLTLANLPNAFMRDAAMYRAWQGAIGDLFSGRRAMIVVPELDAIDLESLRALRTVLRALRDRATFRIVIGHDPACCPADPIDKFFRALRLTELTRLEALPLTTVERATQPVVHGEAPRKGALDVLDDGLESRAYAALASHGAAEPDTRTLVVEALRAAFDAFAFEPAFRLAQPLLTTTGSDEAITRDALRLGSLALSNLAPLGKEPWINAALVDGFTRLIASEADPLARAHWNYRLALLHARGRNAIDEGRLAAEAAVAEVEAVADNARAPLFLAWALNGRAYTRSRSGDLGGAAADTERAHAALDAGAAGVSEAEVHLTRLFVANNRARVAQFAADEDALAKWRAIRTRHFDALEAVDRPGPLWLPVPGGHHDLAAQRDHHAAVLADARDRLDVDDEAIAAHGLGIVLYKLGDASGAHEAFATSLRIWSVIGGFPEDLLAEQLNTAVTAFRAGDIGRATEGFARVRSNALMQNAAAQAETLAALAMIDARAGERERAVARANEAIRAAEALGEPDVVVRTLRSAAEAHLSLGDRRRAAEILTKAQATSASAERDGVELPAEDLLGVMVSQLDACVGGNADALRRALQLAPLVVGDANAWWDLPRLAAHVRAHAEIEREGLAEGLATVSMVDGQRAEEANRHRGDHVECPAKRRLEGRYPGHR